MSPNQKKVSTRVTGLGFFLHYIFLKSLLAILVNLLMEHVYAKNDILKPKTQRDKLSLFMIFTDLAMKISNSDVAKRSVTSPKTLESATLTANCNIWFF